MKERNMYASACPLLHHKRGEREGCTIPVNIRVARIMIVGISVLDQAPEPRNAIFKLGQA
jgi:hypothetical protein